MYCMYCMYCRYVRECTRMCKYVPVSVQANFSKYKDPSQHFISFHRLVHCRYVQVLQVCASSVHAFVCMHSWACACMMMHTASELRKIAFGWEIAF
jgi:hypothetical protein